MCIYVYMMYIYTRFRLVCHLLITITNVNLCFEWCCATYHSSDGGRCRSSNSAIRLEMASHLCTVSTACSCRREALELPSWLSVEGRKKKSLFGGPCCVTQQTFLLCVTADMSAVRHGRDVCCETQPICLLSETADMSAV